MKVTSEDVRKAKENVLYKKNEGTPEGLYVLVKAPPRGMLRVYNPDARGRVAPEGGGIINRNITSGRCFNVFIYGCVYLAPL